MTTTRASPLGLGAIVVVAALTRCASVGGLASCTPAKEVTASAERPAPSIAAPTASVGADPSSSPSAAAPALRAPPPACVETAGTGPWPRAAGGEGGLPRVVGSAPGALGKIEQRFENGRPARLRFLGAHLFDMLDKVLYEGGGGEDARRRTICTALNAVAESGAPVVRLWGSLKRTGADDEVRWAADMLELILDENARRERPLRFVIALLNHQAGYGSPKPDRSLDDQGADHPWSARRIYLARSWRGAGQGLLADRMRRFGERPAIKGSPYILAWELVNELDTFRSVAGGSLAGAEADALRDTFIVPAMTMLAETFPQPLMVGDLRGAAGGYTSFARSVVEALPSAVRARLVWTSHVYGVKGEGPAPGAATGARAPWTWKLDLDLDLAASIGAPFVVGEVGQHVRGVEARFCRDGPQHDIEELLRLALGDRPIDAAILWGEGLCALEVQNGSSLHRLSIGAGGDSADLGPNEGAAREAVRAARRLPRFQATHE